MASPPLCPIVFVITTVYACRSSWDCSISTCGVLGYARQQTRTLIDNALRRAAALRRVLHHTLDPRYGEKAAAGELWRGCGLSFLLFERAATLQN